MMIITNNNIGQLPINNNNILNPDTSIFNIINNEIYHINQYTINISDNQNVTKADLDREIKGISYKTNMGNRLSSNNYTTLFTSINTQYDDVNKIFIKI